MLIAALAVPATTWWVSVRYYSAHQEKQESAAADQTWKPMLQEQRRRMLEDVRQETTIEGMPEVRRAWNGPMDPDNFWNGQMQQANKTLILHQLTALNASDAPPTERRLPDR